MANLNTLTSKLLFTLLVLAMLALIVVAAKGKITLLFLAAFAGLVAVLVKTVGTNGARNAINR